MTDVMEPEMLGDEYDVVLVPTDVAHIVYPYVEVGEKSLALCGKKWKVKTEWAGVPYDQPVCRDCIDAAVDLLVDAEAVLMEAFLAEQALKVQAEYLAEVTGGVFAQTLQAGRDYQNQRSVKATEKKIAKVQKAQEKFFAKEEAAAEKATAKGLAKKKGKGKK